MAFPEEVPPAASEWNRLMVQKQAGSTIHCRMSFMLIQHDAQGSCHALMAETAWVNACACQLSRHTRLTRGKAENHNHQDGEDAGLLQN